MNYKQYVLISCLLYTGLVYTSALSQKNIKEVPRPNRECYWAVPNRLLAGQYPGAHDENSTRKKLRSYLDAGITFFLDLTEQSEISLTGERKPYALLLQLEAKERNIKVHHCRMSIRDFGIPTKEFMTKILDVIDTALNAGHKVYVHCWGGIGRTGTVVGCYFVRKGESGEQALKHLATLWHSVGKAKKFPLSPEMEIQRQFVVRFGMHSPFTHTTLFNKEHNTESSLEADYSESSSTDSEEIAEDTL